MGILDRFKKRDDSESRRDTEDLRALKTRIWQLRAAHPSQTKVSGSFAQKPDELIPLICDNIQDAVSGIASGQDAKGNRISEAGVGKGLGKLVQATREPRFVGGISLALNAEGVLELTKAMDEVEAIARRLEARAT